MQEIQIINVSSITIPPPALPAADLVTTEINNTATERKKNYIGNTENPDSLAMYMTIEQRMGELACTLLVALMRETKVLEWQQNGDHSYTLILDKKYIGEGNSPSKPIVTLNNIMKMCFSIETDSSCVEFLGDGINGKGFLPIKGKATSGKLYLAGELYLKKIQVNHKETEPPISVTGQKIIFGIPTSISSSLIAIEKLQTHLNDIIWQALPPQEV